MSTKHDVRTFLHVLSDYLENHGIAAALPLQYQIAQVCFDPEHNLRPVCALQSGNKILFAPLWTSEPIHSLIWLDIYKQECRQVSVRESLEKITT